MPEGERGGDASPPGKGVSSATMRDMSRGSKSRRGELYGEGL